MATVATKRGSFPEMRAKNSSESMPSRDRLRASMSSISCSSSRTRLCVMRTSSLATGTCTSCSCCTPSSPDGCEVSVLFDLSTRCNLRSVTSAGVGRLPVQRSTFSAQCSSAAASETSIGLDLPATRRSTMPRKLLLAGRLPDCCPSTD